MQTDCNTQNMSVAVFMSGAVWNTSYSQTMPGGWVTSARGVCFEKEKLYHSNQISFHHLQSRYSVCASYGSLYCNLRHRPVSMLTNCHITNGNALLPTTPPHVVTAIKVHESGLAAGLILCSLHTPRRFQNAPPACF